MYDYDEDSKLDNGGPAFFGILGGIIEIIWGIVELVTHLWRRH